MDDELERIRSAFDQAFWSTIPAVPGALEACQRLADQGYILVCVAALAERFADARAQTLRDLGFPISRAITTRAEIIGGLHATLDVPFLTIEAVNAFIKRFLASEANFTGKTPCSFRFDVISYWVLESNAI